MAHFVTLGVTICPPRIRRVCHNVVSGLGARVTLCFLKDEALRLGGLKLKKPMRIIVTTEDQMEGDGCGL